MPDASSWLLTTISGALLVPIYRSGDYLGCNPQPLSLWYSGMLTILWSYVLMYHIASLFGHVPNFAACLMVMIFPVVFLFKFVWMILGTIWLIQNIVVGNQCLTLFNLIFMIFILLLWYLIYISFIVALVKRVREDITKRRDTNNMTAKLLELYKDKSKVKDFDIHKFKEKYSPVLTSMPLIDAEKDIIEEYFTTEVEESSNGDSCAVCLNEFAPGDRKCKIGCTHEFHVDCVVGWYKVKPSCPYCRESFRDAMLLEYQKKVKESNDSNA